MNETETFQHYQVLRRADGTLWELGRGAMGITYKAFDVNLRCNVALKVVNAAFLNSETARARFVREARAAAQLRHRNVASVYHLGMDGESFFYAMEFIDGETLDGLVRRRGPLRPAAALRLALQVSRALGAAFRRRLVHRDIKPANLMVVRDEDEDHQLVVKVIDFGLARSVFGAAGDHAGQSAPSALTLSGGFVGTPQYASPEQLEEQDLDTRSDIYSLGVTLWFLLTGLPPFSGTLAGIISQHLTREPPWDKLDPQGVPDCVRKLLERMLQKDRANRPQDPFELRRELEDCMRSIQDAAASEGPEHFGQDEIIHAATTASEPGAGAVIANRFRLERLVGEGTGGRVFRGQDSQRGRPVAMKLLNPELIVTPQDEQTLADDLARSRKALHPSLVETFSLERHDTRHFLIQEWLDGFTLIDLLRQRGSVSVEDALRLLRQASGAADAAAASGLGHRLDLAPHQIFIHFPAADLDPEHSATARPVPSGPLSGWPEWRLKIDPLGMSMEAGDQMTWAGEMTLVPDARPLSHDTQSSIRGFVESSALHALGNIIYELLGGSPTRTGEWKYVSRPALSEEANAVLRRCMAENPGFASAAEFYIALCRAEGFDPFSLRPAAPFPGLPSGAPRALLRGQSRPVPGNLSGVSEARVTLPSPESSVLPEPAASASIRLPGELRGGRGNGVLLGRFILVAGFLSFLAVGAFVLSGAIQRRQAAARAAAAATKHQRKPDAAPSRASVYAPTPVPWPRALEVPAPLPATAGRTPVLPVEGSPEPPANPPSEPIKETRVPPGLPAVISAGALRPSPSPSQPPPALSLGSAAAEARAANLRPVAEAPPEPAPLPAPPAPLVEESKATDAEKRDVQPLSERPPSPVVEKPNSPSEKRAAQSNPPERPPAAVSEKSSTSSEKRDESPDVGGNQHRVVEKPSTSSEKRVRVRLTSDPEGAEITWHGESLGTTPLSTTLPPGDYVFIAHYKNWPEVGRTVSLKAHQETEEAHIRMLSPEKVPLAQPPAVPPQAAPAPAARPVPPHTAGRRWFFFHRGEAAPDPTPAPGPTLEPFEPAASPKP